MAIEYESIIQKMITELQYAKTEQHHYAKMKRHIANVHVLSELILDEESPGKSTDNITSQEIKAMLGNNKNNTNNQSLGKSSLDADQEEPGSIFDF